jgi:hypothetical protein
MYDPQIGRWHVPDPLNEYEYKYSVDKELKEELGNEGLGDDDEEGISDIRKDIDSYLQILGPINLTAENSAIHYSESPYAYVLNNPLSYIDPLGLDTATLPTATVKGSKPSAPLLGPLLIGLGQRITALKRVGALGSEKGSSIASKTLAKVIPQTFTKVIGKKLGTKIAMKVGTNVIGRALGRLVPYVGWALTVKDVWDYRKEIHVFGQGMAIGMKEMQDAKDPNIDFMLGK